MKTIGLLGGMSWESSQTYYRLINQQVKQQLGGLHSAKIVMYSVDFAEIEALQHAGEWNKTADILSNAAQSLERAGADFLLIATNTMHKVADQIQQTIKIPLLHIADATANALLENNVQKVGLLGTNFTMSQSFYRGRLTDKFSIDVITPAEEDKSIVHDIIYKELCLGKINPTSKEQYLRIINNLAEQGAQGVILGCTEIALLVNQADTQVLLFDTTEIHAITAVDYALR